MRSLSPSLPDHVRRYPRAYLVFLIALLPTLVAFYRVQLNVDGREQARFETSISLVETELQQRGQRYVDAMLGLRGLFVASENVYSHEWGNYLESIELARRFPGISGCLFAERVTTDTATAHVQRMRKDGLPGYTLELSDEVFPVVYRSSFGNTNIPSRGANVFADAALRELLEEARDSGRALYSGPIKTGDSHPGILLCAPVYRGTVPPESRELRRTALQGFLIAHIRLDAMFMNLMPNRAPDVALTIFDGRIGQMAVPLFASSGTGLASGSPPRFQKRVEIPLAHRVWTAEFRTLPAFDADAAEYLPWATLAGGLIIAGLIAGVTVTESRSRRRAETLSANLQASQETLSRANSELKLRIDEKVRAEESLAHERDLLRTLLDHLPDRVYFKDLQSRFIKCSREVVRRLNLKDPDETIGKTDADFFHSEHSQRALADEQKIIQTGEPLIGLVEKESLRDGSVSWVLTTKMPYRDKSGAIIGTFGTSKDITALKRSEEALENEKERLTVTLRSIGDGVIATNTDGAILLSNKAAEDLLVCGAAEILGRQTQNLLELLDEKTETRVSDPVLRVLLSGGSEQTREPVLLRALDGTKRLITYNASPIEDRSGKIAGVVMVFRDVTQNRLLEEELLKSSKLESIGLLAGGIAHDFNNILTAIIGNLSLAKLNPTDPAKVVARISDAERAATRARDLTHHLLTFAKGGAPIKRSLDLGPLLRDLASLGIRGTEIQGQVLLHDGLWWVDVDQAQLSQVINNVVSNARDAMSGGGELNVSCCNVELRDGQVAPLRAGRYVQVTVRDTGHGISSEHLSKVFDPYFTTKEQGIGMGLAAAYSIIRKHDGQIRIESVTGRGTTVTFYLPAAASPVPAVEKFPAQKFSGAGRILVMDDEEDIRLVASMMLELLGYEVELARDGAEALDAYMRAKGGGKPFDAVIMDLTIVNGMGGKETIQRLTSLDPSVKAIVSSGYSLDPVMANFREHGFGGVVPKPYKVEDLGNALRELLARH